MRKRWLRFIIVFLFFEGLFSFRLAISEGSPPPWDLSYLLTAKPQEVTDEELYRHALVLEENHEKYHQVDGIIWPAIWDDPQGDYPTHYGSGGDSALFTGFYLAGEIYRFLVTKNEEALDMILKTLRGLHILTHISGTAGVISRCAFPMGQEEKWYYPQSWQHRIQKGFVYESPSDGNNENLQDILNPGQMYPQMIFYTRATRDQLTGILFGLSVVWGELRPERVDLDSVVRNKIIRAREIVKKITEALWGRLKNQDFTIRDHRGKTGSNATSVSGMLKLALVALYKEVLSTGTDGDLYQKIQKKYEDEFKSVFKFGRFGGEDDIFSVFNNYYEYYAWNLRFSTSFCVWMLEHDQKRKQCIAGYIKTKLWHYVKDHQNTHFTFLYNVSQGTNYKKMFSALSNLKAQSLRPLRSWSSPLHDRQRKPNFFTLLFGDVSPYVVSAHLRGPTQYFVWQKDPFFVGEGIDYEGKLESPGLDFLLPYWFGRHYGFVGNSASE